VAPLLLAKNEAPYRHVRLNAGLGPNARLRSNHRARQEPSSAVTSWSGNTRQEGTGRTEPQLQHHAANARLRWHREAS